MDDTYPCEKRSRRMGDRTSEKQPSSLSPPSSPTLPSGRYASTWLIMGIPFVIIFSSILLASLFLVRIFIFFHDCTHGSYFASNRANRILGHITGILTFTPFDYWRLTHNIHHGTYADLDHRGFGDYLDA